MAIDFLKELFSDSELQSSKVGKVSTTKSSIYRAEIFANCVTRDDAKAIRKNIRKELDIHIHNFVISAKSQNQNWVLETLKEFCAFYAKTYTNNDFTVYSVCDNVAKKQSAFGGQNWINQVTKLLDYAKKYANK